jgi:hypothetical protein
VSCSSRKKSEDQTHILLPEGTTPRIIARSGFQVLADNPNDWISAPDGADTLALNDGDWIYVCNSERNSDGGVSAIRFDSTAKIVDSAAVMDAG